MKFRSLKLNEKIHDTSNMTDKFAKIATTIEQKYLLFCTLTIDKKQLSMIQLNPVPVLFLSILDTIRYDTFSESILSVKINAVPIN